MHLKLDQTFRSQFTIGFFEETSEDSKSEGLGAQQYLSFHGYQTGHLPNASSSPGIKKVFDILFLTGKTQAILRERLQYLQSQFAESEVILGMSDKNLLWDDDEVTQFSGIVITSSPDVDRLLLHVCDQLSLRIFLKKQNLSLIAEYTQLKRVKEELENKILDSTNTISHMHQKIQAHENQTIQLQETIKKIVSVHEKELQGFARVLQSFKSIDWKQCMDSDQFSSDILRFQKVIPFDFLHFEHLATISQLILKKCFSSKRLEGFTTFSMPQDQTNSDKAQTGTSKVNSEINTELANSSEIILDNLKDLKAFLQKNFADQKILIKVIRGKEIFHLLILLWKESNTSDIRKTLFEEESLEARPRAESKEQDNFKKTVLELFLESYALAIERIRLQIGDQSINLQRLKRVAFEEKIREEVGRAFRTKSPFVIAILGINHFSEVKEIYGTPMIDNFYQKLLHYIRDTSRVHDSYWRIGENELCILLPHTSLKGAALKLDRLRRALEGGQIDTHLSPFITTSIGMTEFPTLTSESHRLLIDARKARKYSETESGHAICIFQG